MTMIHELGVVVAERELEARGINGERRPVVVKLGKPHPDPLGTVKTGAVRIRFWAWATKASWRHSELTPYKLSCSVCAT